MVFTIESIVAYLLFTLMLELATRNRREAFANYYPPAVAEKLRALLTEEIKWETGRWCMNAPTACYYLEIFTC